MQVGYRVEKRVFLSSEDVRAFATELGDTNPLHHDEAYAKGTRFGGLIASGAHPIALLVALGGAQASREFPGVGLEFKFRLLRPVKAGTEITLRWEVVGSEPKPKLDGQILSLRGAVLDAAGNELVAAEAKTLFVTSL